MWVCMNDIEMGKGYNMMGMPYTCTKSMYWLLALYIHGVNCLHLSKIIMK